jgi:adenylosuccinate lyase
MRHDLEASHGLVFSQRVLLALVEAGLSRDAAYGLVQRNALAAWDEERDFAELVALDPDITMRLDADALARAFDLGDALRHVDVIFERLGILAEKARERKEEAVHA